jgi:hypothetical protein
VNVHNLASDDQFFIILGGILGNSKIDIEDIDKNLTIAEDYLNRIKVRDKENNELIAYKARCDEEEKRKIKEQRDLFNDPESRAIFLAKRKADLKAKFNK